MQPNIKVIYFMDKLETNRCQCCKTILNCVSLTLTQCLNKLERLFRARLVFPNNDRAYHGAPLKRHAPIFTCKCCTSLEILAREKHSSLTSQELAKVYGWMYYTVLPFCVIKLSSLKLKIWPRQLVAGDTNWRGRLSAVDLLINAACFCTKGK